MRDFAKSRARAKRMFGALLFAIVSLEISRLKRRRRKRRRTSPQKSWLECTGYLSDPHFFLSYRVTRQQFDDLLARILETTPSFQRQRSNGTDPRLRLASCLRHLAGAHWNDCARIHGQARSTFFSQFRETMDALRASRSSRAAILLREYDQRSAHR